MNQVRNQLLQISNKRYFVSFKVNQVNGRRHGTDPAQSLNAIQTDPLNVCPNCLSTLLWKSLIVC